MIFDIPLTVFENKYKIEKEHRAKLRVQILLLRRQKYSQQEIAVIVRVTQGTVSNVCNKFEKFGWISIHDKPRDGRPTKMSNENRRALKKKMSREIIDGKDIRGWQTKDVKNVIRHEYETEYSDRQIRRIMHGIGMSWKVPRPEHKNRDENEVYNFKKTSRGRFCLWQMNTRLPA